MRYDAWVDDLREDCWRLWMPRQTWDGTPFVMDGRPALLHALRQWFRPARNPHRRGGPAEGPAE